jgi:hypothetical protein
MHIGMFADSGEMFERCGTLVRLNATGQLAQDFALAPGRRAGFAPPGAGSRAMLMHGSSTMSAPFRGELVPPPTGSACPDGVDVYFENVGGDVLDALLPLKSHARMPVCGFIAHYNEERGERGTDKRTQGRSSPNAYACRAS